MFSVSSRVVSEVKPAHRLILGALALFVRNTGIAVHHPWATIVLSKQ
jgi:hypothetical protein